MTSRCQIQNCCLVLMSCHSIPRTSLLQLSISRHGLQPHNVVHETTATFSEHQSTQLPQCPRIPVDIAAVVVFSALCPARVCGDGQQESTEASSAVRPPARKPEKHTSRCSLAGQVCPAVLVETWCAVAGELERLIANRKRQPGRLCAFLNSRPDPILKAQQIL